LINQFKNYIDNAHGTIPVLLWLIVGGMPTTAWNQDTMVVE